MAERDIRLTHASSDEGDGTSSGFAINFYAVDDDGKHWRLTVLISREFGFSGLLVDVADQSGAFPSDLSKEEEGWYPPFSQVELQQALQRVRDELSRTDRYEWTRVYPERYRQLCSEYERFQSIMAGEQPIEEYGRSTQHGNASSR